jgi:queuine tRNA-ribosyltransferase
MRQMREAIGTGTLQSLADTLRAEWEASDWTEDEMPQPAIPLVP